MSYKKLLLFSLIATGALGWQLTKTDGVPLIPQEVLFGNPTYAAPTISPDGTHIAYLAPSNGVMNIFVQPVDQATAAQVITHDIGSGIKAYWWSYNNTTIFYEQDHDGDENWNIYKVDIATQETTCLTPYPDAQARAIHYSKKFPNRMLISLNKEDKQLHDVYELDLITGNLTFIEKNPGNNLEWNADDNLQLRTSLLMNEDGSTTLLHRLNNSSSWTTLIEAGSDVPEDGCASVGFSANGEALYCVEASDNDTARLVRYSPLTGTKEILASDPHYDISPALIMHPETKKPLMTSIQRAQHEIILLDETYRPDVELLKQYKKTPFTLASFDQSFNLWVVAFSDSNVPREYYLYNRTTQALTFLSASNPELGAYTLAKTEPIVFTARDGLTVHGYITYPTTRSRTLLPTVLFVHGGPHVRDTMNSCSSLVQLLTNRGYACVQINYRGSTGYGNAFAKAGYKEWGGAMQHDLTDAVKWLIEQQISDPKRIAILGGSYGGYAALAGATFTPDLYCCSVSLCGVSNLVTLLKSIPPYWKPYRARLNIRVGNLETEQQFLEERSPLFSAHAIRIPLFIAQGANDPRVKQEEAEQIVAALKRHDIPHEYLLFDNEGHGLSRPENRLSCFKAIEKFLAHHLGGRCEA